MTQSELISTVVDVVIRDMLEEWQISRGVRIRELDMQDLPMPQSGMNGEQLAAYFDLQVKQGKTCHCAMTRLGGQHDRQ